MSNAQFFEAVAPFYSDIYFEVDADESVRQWVQLFETHGLIPSCEERNESPPRLLDLGCGIGAHLRAWRAAGFLVSGLDISPTMLEIAARSDEIGLGKEIALYCADICDIERLKPLQGSFDWIASHFNFLHLFTPDQLYLLFSGVNILLTQGGRFAVDLNLNEEASNIPEQSAYTVSENCQFIRETIDSKQSRIDREWRLGGMNFIETYWLHSRDDVSAAANAGQMEVAKCIPWLNLQKEICSAREPGANREILIFAKKNDPKR